MAAAQSVEGAAQTREALVAIMSAAEIETAQTWLVDQRAAGNR